MPHILLIDDDDLFRPMLRSRLEFLGHDVTEAQDGMEGLRLLARTPADLVLTDLIMPKKEGIETIVELRKNHPGVKIIAMSGGGRVAVEDYLHLAKQLGAGRVLKKPFSSEELKVAIDELLAEKKSGDHPARGSG